jgi:AraC-like DNA-binding protein
MLDYWKYNCLDADESRSRLGSVLRSHRLQIMGATSKFRANICHLGDSRMSMTRLSYGAAVCVEPQPEPGFWIMSVPIRGSVRVSHSSRDIHSSPGVASMISSSSPVAGYWQEGTEQAVFRLSGVLLKEAAQTLGMAEADIHSCQPMAVPLAAHLGLLPACLDAMIKLNTSDLPFASQNLLEKQWHMLAMLIAQAAVSGQLMPDRHQDRQALPSHTLRKILDAQAWVDRTLLRDEVIDVHALAQYMGLTLRPLQILMRKHQNMTAHQFLESRRLVYARHLLQNARMNVAEAALSAGFNHLGRFAKKYTDSFGISPKGDRLH